MQMTNRSISRRRFTQLLGLSAGCAAVKPALSLAKSIETVASANLPSPASTAVVRLSSNENPYGPSLSALKAMTDSFSLACRYPDEHADELVERLAKLNGVNREQILLGDGSGEILKLCAAAFT